MLKLKLIKTTGFANFNMSCPVIVYQKTYLTKSWRSKRGLSILYGGQFTLSTQLINPIFVFHFPTDLAPQSLNLETNPLGSEKPLCLLTFSFVHAFIKYLLHVQNALNEKQVLILKQMLQWFAKGETRKGNNENCKCFSIWLSLVCEGLWVFRYNKRLQR